jgi:hypothetical protein
MTHPLHHVVEFERVGDYRLRIRFDDGLERIIDLEGILWGELYGPLRDPEVFGTVRLDPEFKTLVWENGADFDPSILHDWPEHERAWHELARKWRSSSPQPAGQP